MGFLSAALGIGSLIMGHNQNKIVNQQFEQSMDLAKNRHQYEVEDLKKAGLNPILSANSGAVSLPSPTAGALNDSFGRAAQSIATARQLDLLKAQSRMMNTQADKNLAEADLAKKNEDTQDWQRRLMDAQIAKSQVEQNNLYSQIDLNSASKNKVLADTSYVWKQIQTYDAQVAAELNLRAAQAEAAVMAGQASVAQAANSYAQATQAYANAGLIRQEQANSLIKGEGLRIANAHDQYRLDVDRASSGAQLDPWTQNWRKIFSYFNPLGALGKVSD